MGRYVYGNENFSYKYVFASQPTNLSALAEWAGVGVNQTTSTFKTQLLLPYEKKHEDSMELVTGVSYLMCVYDSVISPKDVGVELSSDFESAIYQIGDDWMRIVRAIDAALPGPAINPDLALARTYSFDTSDWAAMAQKIGHGADPTDIESLKTAREKVFESGEDDYLPLLAANALLHAVENEIEQMQLVDGEQGQTNLWSVVTDYSYDSPNETWEDRFVHARLKSFSYETRNDAIELLDLLVAERPADENAVSVLLAQYVWDERWDDIFALCEKLLSADLTDSVKGLLLQHRGEFLANQEKMDESRSDAESAADLGRPQLLNLLNDVSS